MKLSKKILTPLVVLSLSATALPIFATHEVKQAPPSAISADVSQESTFETLKTDVYLPVLVRSKQHIDETYNGKKDYKESFSCLKSQGNTLNIYVKNNGSKSVNFLVKMNGKSMGTETVVAGKGLTRTFVNSNGISDEFEVIVSSDFGETLNLKVEARQYEK